MSTTTLTIRIDEQTKERLDRLAKSTSRSKSYLVANAIEEYLSINEWQIQELVKTIEKADSADAKFVDHEKIAEWLDSWGTENELEPPECR